MFYFYLLFWRLPDNFVSLLGFPEPENFSLFRSISITFRFWKFSLSLLGLTNTKTRENFFHFQDNFVEIFFGFELMTWRNFLILELTFKSQFAYKFVSSLLGFGNFPFQENTKPKLSLEKNFSLSRLKSHFAWFPAA